MTRWLIGNGFEVDRTSRDSVLVRLIGSKASERVEITLEPRSALATRVLISAGGSGAPVSRRLGELRAQLEEHARATAEDVSPEEDEAPSAVERKRGAVVCIEAVGEGAALQLTGFAVNGGGRIVTTAHDLESLAEVSVRWEGGPRGKGRVVRVDREKDLALVETAARPKLHLRLDQSRTVLGDGEKIFSVGCPLGQQETIRSGRVLTPMRRLNSSLLWEVEMETLPGTSGSPVFDGVGNLVGVVRGRLRGGETKGFVIPMETVLRFLSAR